MEQYRQKNQKTDTGRYDESGANGYSIEERVNDHADKGRNTNNRIHELIMMGFLSEVQVRGEGVFEHMHNQVSEKHQYRRRHRQRQAFRKHLETDCAQHESRS